MLHVADESGIYPVILPAPGIYRTDESDGDGSVFGVLEGGGGPTDSVFLFVGFF